MDIPGWAAFLGCSSPSRDSGIHIPSTRWLYVFCAWMTSRHYLALEDGQTERIEELRAVLTEPPGPVSMQERPGNIVSPENLHPRNTSAGQKRGRIFTGQLASSVRRLWTSFLFFAAVSILSPTFIRQLYAAPSNSSSLSLLTSTFSLLSFVCSSFPLLFYR